jgi:hypothetical protein
MASSAPPQPRVTTSDAPRWMPVIEMVWAVFITAVIAGPWFSSGFFFGTDWPGPRHFDLPSQLSSTAPLEVLLWGAATLLSGEVAGKLFVIATVFLCAWTAFKAVPDGTFITRVVASTIYLANPFVYGRLHYGQLFLLAGYALLPLLLSCLHRLLREPGWRSAAMTTAAAAAIGAVSPHTFLMASVTCAILTLAHVILAGSRAPALGKTALWAVVAAASTAIATSYWTVPLAAGTSSESTVVGPTGTSELYAFAAKPDAELGLLPNILGLYGFWAEDIGRFTSMKAFVPGWPFALGALLALCGIGIYAAFVGPNRPLRAWVTGLVVAGALALVFEAGVSAPPTSPVVLWLDAHLAIYRGMRDAGKWAAVLALAYSQLGGLGAKTLVSWAGRFKSRARSDWSVAMATAVVLALSLYYGNGLFFGSHGTIRPSTYPSGWYAADRMLIGDPNHGRALFLPWHEYMHYSFIKNQNSVVASPAPSFFSVPILASQDPEVPGITPPATPAQEAVRGLVAQGPSGDWAETLANLGIAYVLVDKDLDWQTYGYLDSQQGLTRVADLGSILVYRNTEAA